MSSQEVAESESSVIAQPLSRKAFFAAVGAAAVAGAAAAATAPADVADAAMVSDLPWFNVRDYGAVGNGVADDAPAIQRALNAIGKNPTGERSGVLYIPQGDYRIGSQITAADASWRLAIRGDGMGISRLFCANGTGVLKITSSTKTNTFTIEHLSFFATMAAAGTAIEIACPEGGSQHARSLIVSHVEMRGVAPATDYFLNGFIATGHWRPLFYDAAFSGVFGPGTEPRKADSTTYKPNFAFKVDGSYAPAFHYCYAWNAAVGYSVVSTATQAPEDASFYRSFAVECKVGIDVSTPTGVGGEPQLEIDTLHINCMHVGIRLQARKFFQITNCLLYGYVYAAGEEVEPYTDIQLLSSFSGVIDHNIFHQPGNPGRNMIVVDANSSDISIRGNTFNASGAAVSVAATATGVRVAHNTFNTKDRLTGLPLVSTVLKDLSKQAIFHTDELRYARATRTSVLTTAKGTWVEIPWEAKPADTTGIGGLPGTGLVLPDMVGIREVRVIAQVQWSDLGAGEGWEEMALYVNGAPAVGAPAVSRPIPAPNSTADSRPMQLVTGPLPVAGGDKISLRVRHSGGAAQGTIQPGGTWISVEVVNG